MRTCKDCRRSFPLENFYFSSKRMQTRSSYCKPCHIVRVEARERLQPIGEVRLRRRAKKLRQLYGMSVEEYDHLLEAQGGVCALCSEPETVVRGEALTHLAVDHDHRNGRVRGLLCLACNTFLGLLDDTPESVRQAFANNKGLTRFGNSQERVLSYLEGVAS